MNNSVALHPEILKFWNYHKNPKPNTVKAKSNEIVSFICKKCDYEWEAQVSSRYGKERPCPRCKDGYNVIDLVPEIINWIDPSNTIDLRALSPKSDKSVAWQCPFCKESYIQRICYRIKPSESGFAIAPCTKCQTNKKDYSKIDIKRDYPKLLDYWLDNLYGSIESITKGSQKYTWHCPNCDNDFTSTAILMIRSYNSPSNGCPFCAGIVKNDSFGSLHPELLPEYSHRNTIDPFSVSENSRKIVEWICPNDKTHFYKKSFKKRVAGYGCNICGVIPEKNTKLINAFPELENYFDEDKNGIPFSKAKLYPRKKYWWKCEKGHSFEWFPIRFKYNCGFYCQICEPKVFVPGIFGSVYDKHKDLMKEWDYVNNYLLADPKKISDNSMIVVWWNCPNNKKHHYPLRVDRRIYYDLRNHEACPFCRGNRIKKHHFI